MRHLARTAVLLVAVAVAALAVGGPAAPALAITVSGHQLVDGHGHALQLRGVNFSGAQYQCLDSKATWDRPADARTIAGMRSWRVNAVRLPINEDCWLGINGLPWHSAAARYRLDIARFVASLHHAGIYVLLNLHTAAPGNQQSRREARMADRDHGPAFWVSVARRFRADPGIVFDLYNEPKRISWSCWRDGCGRYAGMSALIAAVRRSGAHQPVMADGLDYGNDLSGWLAHAPHDPRGQLVAGFHNYGDLACRVKPCWNRSVLRVAAAVPVITGETGEFDCAHGYIDRFLPWADQHGISYLAWAWNAFDCAREPSLLSADGTPSPYGIGYRDHLLGRAAGAKPR